MKKYVGVLIALTMVLSPISAYADVTATENPSAVSTAVKLPYTIKEKDVTNADKKIEGKLPVFADVTNQKLSDSLKAQVDAVYNSGVKTMESMQAKSLKFSYDVFLYDAQYLSIVMHTEVSAGNTSSDKVNTIVLNSKENKQYTLLDLTGPNGYKICNEIISDYIKAAPEGSYLTGKDAFNGVNNATQFYVDNDGILQIIFSKYEIAPGVDANPTFSVAFQDIKNYKLDRIGYVLQDKVVEVPLRKLAEEFGYKITWSEEKGAVDLERGDQKITVYMHKNDYNGIQLESAPRIINDRTFVPISFFEKLAGVCYSLDTTLNEYTFSQLIDK